jgi:hypothetical protein
LWHWLWIATNFVLFILLTGLGCWTWALWTITAQLQTEKEQLESKLAQLQPRPGRRPANGKAPAPVRPKPPEIGPAPAPVLPKPPAGPKNEEELEKNPQPKAAEELPKFLASTNANEMPEEVIKPFVTDPYLAKQAY